MIVRLLASSGVSYHGGDPLTRVNGAVEVDGGLRALASASPEMNAGDFTALEGSSRLEYLRVVGEGRLQVRQEGQVISVRMVRLKPRWVGYSGDTNVE